jgi:hypothetical protein
MQHIIEKMNSKQVDTAPLRTSWVGLHVIHVPPIKPTIETPQTIDVSKIVQTMEDIPIDIGKHVFNIKYTLSLGQLMQIVLDIKKFLSKKPKPVTIIKVPMVIPNSIQPIIPITSTPLVINVVVVDNHMVIILLRDIVEDVLIDGRSMIFQKN